MPEADLPTSYILTGSNSVYTKAELREVSMPEPRLSDELLACRQRTMALIYGTAMLERMDEQILPAVRLCCRSGTISSQSHHACTSSVFRAGVV